MKRAHRIVAALAAAALLTAAAAAVSRLYYGEATAASSAVVEEMHCPAVTAPGCDTLLLMVTPGGDTCVALRDDSAFLRRHTVLRPATWVNRLWLPSCRGTVAVRDDSLSHSATVTKAAAHLAAATRRLRRLYSDYYGQQTEVDYYLRTHTITDEGYDIVVRRQSTLATLRDSLLRLLTAATRIAAARPVAASWDTYTIAADSVRMAARPLKPSRTGFRLLRAVSATTPDGARAVYLGARHLGAATRRATYPTVPGDTLTAAIEGNKRRVWYPNGEYYEGGTLDTATVSGHLARHGFGVHFTATAIQPGLWSADRYRGEQPTYTAQHIYGIDISRYQHEPGTYTTVRRGRRRVRRKQVFPIQWERLRITSLGTLSRKKVDGTVDYPISFIYIKNTEGVSIRNRYYASDYSQARRHGFRTGTYHFFSTRSAARAQARFFLQSSRYQKGDMPPVLDVEPTPAQVSAMGGAAAMLRAVRVWLETVERSLGVRPMLYVSQRFVGRYLTARYADGDHLRSRYQVWIARYGEYKPDVHLALWQLCPDGRVSGIRGAVDISVFNGYGKTFREFR